MTIEKIIIDKIIKEKSIDVGEFISLCQFKNNGYYLKNNPIGKKNDFITSPEVSQMFGEMLAVFLINFWEKKFKSDFNLIELGPGRGTLLKDILKTAKINQKFLDSTKITLVEKNINLTQIQKKNIYFPKINWNEEFIINNKKIPSIIYSNEFFDCFPVRQFYKEDKWYEKIIKYNNFEKNLIFKPKIVKDNKILKILKKFDHVKVAEISESRKKYFDIVCKFIKKNKGIFITIDYGYKNLPSYFTLQTIFNHKKTHLFENLGNQDISAHVNFDEFINIAKDNDLKIDLFCTQREFLITCGIKKRKDKLEKNKNEEAIKNLNLEYERLINKYQMGELFKVLVISCI